MRPEMEQSIRARASKLANTDEVGDIQVYAAGYLDRHLLLLEIDDLRVVVQRLREFWPVSEWGERTDAEIAKKLTPAQRAILGITDLAIDIQRHKDQDALTATEERMTSTAEVAQALRGEGA